jgi:hypothetical protein
MSNETIENKGIGDQWNVMESTPLCRAFLAQRLRRKLQAAARRNVRAAVRSRWKKVKGKLKVEKLK